MIVVEKINRHELIEDACSLLHEEYIKKGNWLFSEDNPSALKIISKNNKEMLVDRITPHAIWFGAFDNDKMIGCIRLFRETKDIPLEVDTYPSAKKIVDEYISSYKPNIYECTRACVNSEYKGKGVLHKLYLKIHEFCRGEQVSIFGTTSNRYVHAILRRIGWPCKKECAFKFEQTDPLPVNLYVASYEDGEVDKIIEKLIFIVKNQQENIT